MSYGRTQAPTGTSRDIDADFLKAYIEEHAAYVAAGDFDRARQVAEILAGLGHQIVKQVKQIPVDDKETAVGEPPLETAIEAPKKRGRPRKTVEEEAE